MTYLIPTDRRTQDQAAVLADMTREECRERRLQARAEAQGYDCARCPECGHTIRGQSWAGWLREDCKECEQAAYQQARSN